MENIFFDINKLKHLGKNVIIGKSVRIRKPEECIIEDDTIIDDFTYISCPVEIGKGCHIASNVSISGGGGKFIMGHYSTISSNTSIHCSSSDYKKVSLELPSIKKELQFGGEVSTIKFGNFVVIGSNSVVLPGVILPDGFACGAFSLVKKQPYYSWCLYVGGSTLRMLHARELVEEFTSHPFYEEIYGKQ